MVLKYLFLFFISFQTHAQISAECETALKSLFKENISQSEAADYLKVQGDLTLHRMAWAYLKAQKLTPTDKILNIEKTILTLLDEKYTSTDPDFIKARDAFEAQPLSRTALAELGPYLKDVLAIEFGEKSKNFILNASDLKLLHALSKFEKESSTDGKYDSRMLASQSKNGMLNFATLINSSYKNILSENEDLINIDLKLQGLEQTIENMQNKINVFISSLSLPTQCKSREVCEQVNQTSSLPFELNENVQSIFWESLSTNLDSDNNLLNNLTYGKIWLNTRNHSSVGKKKINITTADSNKNPKITLIKENQASSTGYYVEDPITTIIKDDPRRNPESWKSFDQEYLQNMSDAIINGDKVFEINGKMYDRKTGKGLTIEAALKFLPPKKSNNFLSSLQSRDPNFITNQIVSVINGDQTFTYKSMLYNNEGKLLNPESVIANVMAIKTGAKNEPSRYFGMDKMFLVSRANSLSNNSPHFKFKNQIYDSLSGRNLSSPFRNLASTEDVKINKQRAIHYRNFSDRETIINYHLDTPNKEGCQFYAVADKKSADISIYTLLGKKVFTKEILIGVKTSDERTRWTQYDDRTHQGSYTTGAGVFTTGQPKSGGNYSKIYNNNILSIEGQQVFAIHQVPNNLFERYYFFGTGNPEDRRVSQGCINMKQSDFIEFSQFIKPTCKIYVLPEEKNNKFVVKDGIVQLISVGKVVNSNNYNYSKNGANFKAIDIIINNSKGKTKDSVLFVKALEDEKSKLMKLFNLDNDDYNDLAMISYAIMGNESSFGASIKFWIKENDQADVIFIKAAERLWKGLNPFHKTVTNTSRGFTQIKYLPDGEWKKAYPEINKNTLDDPKNSAVSTIAYLAGAVRTLKSIGNKNALNPKTVQINKENIMDYLGYVYQGRTEALKSATVPANADFNTYVQGLRRNMSYIEVAQKTE